MKTHNPLEQNLPGKNSARTLLFALVTIIGLFAALNVQAASQTWTNAPVDNTWNSVSNWVGRAVPGALNSTGTGDRATFISPLAFTTNLVNNLDGSTNIVEDPPGVFTTNEFPNTFTTNFFFIGGAANPIVNDATRGVRGLTFDTADVGAYVFGIDSSVQLEIMHSGFTEIGAAVTNPITFNAPLRAKLPSSTNGRYDFTNNAANPSASFFLGAIFNTSANTRPLELHLAGSNTGTNTIAYIDDNGGANGAVIIIKEGTGSWILSGANQMPQKTSAGNVARVQVSDGLLRVQDPGSLGSITVANLVVQTTGVLQIDGVTLNNAAITLRNGGTVRMNGIGTVNGITEATTANTSATLATTSASDVMTVGNGANLVTGGAASTILHVTGPGTVLLPYGNNYTGNWSLDAGTNQLADAGALGTGLNLNINAGAVFNLTPLGAATYTLSTKALSASGTGTAMGSTAATIYADAGGIVDLLSKPITLTYTPATFTGDTTHPALLIAQGTLAVNGNSITVNNASGTALGAGTYQLVHQATGNITSSGGFVTLVTGTGLGSGLIGEIVASGGNLNLVVFAYTPISLVWLGGNPDNTWDRQITANWLAGVTPSVFNLYDNVTFNSTGSGFPTVNLAQILTPGSVKVDTSANDYTLSGSGQIAGGAGLTKISTGTLFINTANTYSGGTLITNGTIKIGITDAIPSTGLGDVTNNSPGIIDLNGFSDTVGALNGNGTVDVTGGGTSTLTVGDNDNSGTFSGVLQNTSGTLGLTKSGLGTETLGGSNTYTGPTVIDFGTLKVVNPNALGSGASALTITAGGNLDVSTNLVIASLSGSGTIGNTSATTNTLTVQNSSTYGGIISGRVGILLRAGTLVFNAANTYVGGTIVSSDAGMSFGTAGQAGTGGVIASNNTTMRLAGNGNALNANFTTVDGATVTFTSATTQNGWNGQFIGSATATNVFSGGNMSIGGINTFSNFLGTVIITNGGVRWGTGNGPFGGDNTSFVFVNGGGSFTRDATIVRLGVLTGNGAITAPSTTPPGTYWIGAKGVDSTYSGTIVGANNIVKQGVGRLTLNGVTTTFVPYSNNDQTFTTNIVAGSTNIVEDPPGTFTTNIVDNVTNLVDNLDQTYSTNYLNSPLITYTGTTIISNGVLALVVPNTFSNSPTITLATTTAVLDASQMGYVSNLLSVDDGFTPTNSFLVTNGVFTLNAGQTLAGRGTVKGSGVISSGTINPGNAGAGGTLSISNGLSINDGATNFFDLSDDLTGVVKPSDLIKVQGNVNLSGNIAVTVGALNGVLTVGTYPVIKYSGNLINEGGVVPSGPISNFTLGGTFINTSRATLMLSNAPGEVDLVVVSLNNLNLTWAGDGASNWWDVANSFTWTNGTDASPIQFYQLDSVTFGDTSNPTNDSVFLSGTLVPSFITTVNSTTNFIFGGNGSIGGSTMLMKKGSGTLILTNGANSYSGGTVISNGVLNAGSDSGNNQNDLALGTGPVTVNSTAELRFGGNSGGTVVRHYIVNPVTVNGGIVRASDGEQHLTNSTVTITATGGTLQTAWATKNLVLDSPLIGTGTITVSAANGTNAAGGQVILNNPSNTISGSVIIVTNANLALVGLAGLSNSPSIDVQRGGTLDVSLRTSASLPLLSGQTLMGNGIIRGRFMTAASGSFLTPGASSIGTLTVTNTGNTTNFSTVTLGGTMVMEINRAASPNSDRLAASTNIFGGTLTVNNIGAALALGDTFQLFTSITNKGTFATTTLPTLPSGLVWSDSLASNGRLTVIAITVVNTTPTNIVTSLTNGILTLSWPLDHTGWRLQSQTNSLAVGIGTNWFDVAGATTTNKVNVTMNLTNGTVFFRLIYP